MTQYHEIITNAQTGEVTEVIRPFTTEELAAQEAAKAVVKPSVEQLQAQLAELSAKLSALENA